MTTTQPTKSGDAEAGKEPLTEKKPGVEASLPARTSEPSGRSWIWMLLLCALIGGGGWAAWHYHLIGGSAAPSTAKGPRSVPVVTSTARTGEMSIYLSGLLGTVTAFQTVTVRTRVDGQIMKVYFTEGQTVHAGDPLVEIDPRPYEVQLAQAKGQLARDKASLTQANKDLNRDKELMVAKAVSPQTLDAQVSTVGQYEGAVKADQAMIDNANLQITYCHITAPFDGRIGLRLVDMGNFVQAAGQTGLAVITQLQPIAVIFPVSQDDIFRVQRKFNTGEDILVEAWNRDNATKLADGKLLAIDNQVDTTTGTVKLKSVFENKDNMLFPNEFVNVKLLIDTRRDVVIIPAAAVQHGPNSTFAFVVKADKTVEMRTLTEGPTEDDQTIIEKGLTAGEIVVTEGTDKLQPGSQIETKNVEAGSKPKVHSTAKATKKPGKRTTKASK